MAAWGIPGSVSRKTQNDTPLFQRFSDVVELQHQEAPAIRDHQKHPESRLGTTDLFFGTLILSEAAVRHTFTLE